MDQDVEERRGWNQKPDRRGQAEDRPLADEKELRWKVRVAPLPGGDSLGDAAVERERAERDDERGDSAARDEDRIDAAADGRDAERQQRRGRRGQAGIVPEHPERDRRQA